MTLDQHPTESRPDQVPRPHRGHGWMMIACCIPMLGIALVLVATGIASAGFLFAALACTAMMALMMRMMSGGAAHNDHTH